MTDPVQDLHIADGILVRFEARQVGFDMDLHIDNRVRAVGQTSVGPRFRPLPSGDTELVQPTRMSSVALELVMAHREDETWCRGPLWIIRVGRWVMTAQGPERHVRAKTHPRAVEIFSEWTAR